MAVCSKTYRVTSCYFTFEILVETIEEKFLLSLGINSLHLMQFASFCPSDSKLSPDDSNFCKIKTAL